jgi:hypothetical protein
MRKWLEKHSVIVAVGAIGVLILAGVGYRFLSGGGSVVVKPLRPANFYDLGTNMLFTASDDVPPIEAPSGKKQANGQPGGVRAYVFACGDCAPPNARFTGFLESYSEKGRAIAVAYAEDSPTVRSKMFAEAGETRLVADPNSAPLTWHPDSSDDGKALLAKARDHCKGKALVECKPEGATKAPFDGGK